VRVFEVAKKKHEKTLS